MSAPVGYRVSGGHVEGPHVEGDMGRGGMGRGGAIGGIARSARGRKGGSGLSGWLGVRERTLQRARAVIGRDRARPGPIGASERG
ncbi:hypothetical protein GCM10020001_071340 [Nonomuraea salmonea]